MATHFVKRDRLHISYNFFLPLQCFKFQFGSYEMTLCIIKMTYGRQFFLLECDHSRKCKSCWRRAESVCVSSVISSILKIGN